MLEEIVIMLVNMGADSNIRDSNDMTALDYARA